jgi:hypothetical protein
MTKAEIASMIEELTNMSDKPLWESNIEGMPQRVGYTTIYAGAKGIRVLTGAGIPRHFIHVKETWGNGRFPTRSAYAKIELNAPSSMDDMDNLDGSVELAQRIVDTLKSMGIKSQMGSRTRWLDR